MDFAQLAEERYSVRKFDQRPIEGEKVEAILKAGRIAPTACNNQPQRILVIDDADSMAKLKKCTSYTFGVPMAFIICFDKTESWVRSFDGEVFTSVIEAKVLTEHWRRIYNSYGWTHYWGQVKMLYQLATEQVEIDLDDGVKVNYRKLGTALKKIVGLDVSDG